jgi:predicted enzyme related to lactoylglutathione lyase
MDAAMTCAVRNIAFDCVDAYRIAQFWSTVTGRPLADDDFPGDPVAVIALDQDTNLYFEHVPESKVVKNRMHLCLRPDGSRDVEVERLIDNGAILLADRREPDGTGWVVLSDPEGNEFCVLPGPKA